MNYQARLGLLRCSEGVSVGFGKVRQGIIRKIYKFLVINIFWSCGLKRTKHKQPVRHDIMLIAYQGVLNTTQDRLFLRNY